VLHLILRLEQLGKVRPITLFRFVRATLGFSWPSVTLGLRTGDMNSGIQGAVLQPISRIWNHGVLDPNFLGNLNFENYTLYWAAKSAVSDWGFWMRFEEGWCNCNP